MANTNEYFYYIHRTPESDYMKFFNKGLIDFDTSFKIGSTMEKVDENVLLNGGLQETMKTALRDGDKYVFLIKIPKCYFPEHEHRDGTWDVPIPLFYEKTVIDKFGRTGTWPVLIPCLIQGCYNKEKGFVTNPNFCPVFDPSGLKFAYEQLQPLRNSVSGYRNYDQYNKRNTNGTFELLYAYDKQNRTWDPFVKYYSEKFDVEPEVLFGEDYFDDELKEEKPKTM